MGNKVIFEVQASGWSAKAVVNGQEQSTEWQRNETGFSGCLLFLGGEELEAALSDAMGGLMDVADALRNIEEEGT